MADKFIQPQHLFTNHMKFLETMKQIFPYSISKQELVRASLEFTEAIVLDKPITEFSNPYVTIKKLIDEKKKELERLDDINDF